MDTGCVYTIYDRTVVVGSIVLNTDSGDYLYLYQVSNPTAKVFGYRTKCTNLGRLFSLKYSTEIS